MATSTRRGQILGEMLWSLLLIFSFATFLLRLHLAAEAEQKKPRWEIRKEVR